MMTENIISLIGKLKKKTEAGQAIWTKTSRENEFKLELNKGAITTDNWQNEGKPSKFVDLAIINENGDIIERAIFNSDEEEYNTVLEIHALANKSYYKIDETIRNIFNELDGEKTVGKGRNDLPF